MQLETTLFGIVSVNKNLFSNSCRLPLSYSRLSLRCGRGELVLGPGSSPDNSLSRSCRLVSSRLCHIILNIYIIIINLDDDVNLLFCLFDVAVNRLMFKQLLA
jgi:hypothetical protein